MIAFLFSLITSGFAAGTVLRAPQIDAVLFQQYLQNSKKNSYTESFRILSEKSIPDTSAIDSCLEAIAFSATQKSKTCFSSMQSLKDQLWTPSLRRILVPFLERLISENLEHKKLYQALLHGLKPTQSQHGELDINRREQDIFLKWISQQSEWQDADFYANGIPLGESSLAPSKSILQWFVVSNAGRTLSFIGTRKELRKFLSEAEDFRFLDCKSVSAQALNLDQIDDAEYFFSPTCTVALKKMKKLETETVFSRWKRSQDGLSTTAQIEKPTQIPKWVAPVLVGLAIGAVALKGKKVSVRMPEL